MTALLFAAVTFVSTALGGLFAVHRRRHLHLVMGVAAGMIIASALLDLLPDAWALARDHGQWGAVSIGVAAAVGFLAFLAVDRAVHSDAAGHREHGVREFGAIAALGLTAHSFIDGMAIGAAFEQSAPLGALIGVAVIAHDFGDGVSTVGVVLGSRGALRASMGWLLVDAAAPLLGVLVAHALHVPRAVLAHLLAFFAGTFLFVGGAHLLPEAARERRGAWPAASFVIGFAFIGAATWALQR